MRATRENLLEMPADLQTALARIRKDRISPELATLRQRADGLAAQRNTLTGEKSATEHRRLQLEEGATDALADGRTVDRAELEQLRLDAARIEADLVMVTRAIDVIAKRIHTANEVARRAIVPAYQDVHARAVRRLATALAEAQTANHLVLEIQEAAHEDLRQAGGSIDSAVPAVAFNDLLFENWRTRVKQEAPHVRL